MKTLGIRLKELRIEKNLLQTDMAALLSVSLRQYQRYEKDKSDMYLSNVILLADYFDVSLDYIAGRSDNRNS